MFTLIVTVLAVLTVLGFLFRIVDSVITNPGKTSPRKNTASGGRIAASMHRPAADLRGVR